jgi:hypothetical protein
MRRNWGRVSHYWYMVPRERLDRPPTDDDVAHGLAELIDSLHEDFPDAIVIEHESVPTASVEVTNIVPKRPDACRMTWVEMGQSELILGIGHAQWEWRRDQATLNRIRQVIDSVARGRVSEVFGPNRSEVTVTLSDGTLVRATAHRGLFSLVPAPGWTRWGRKVAYSGYS